MKNIIFTICFSASVAFCYAQPSENKNSVKGIVKSSSGTTLPSVTVSLLAIKDSALKKAEITDEKGQFNIIKIKPGKYFLSYTIVGFEKAYSPAFNLKDGQTFTAALNRTF